MRGFMSNYRIWCLHGEVGVNVAQANNDDVDMPDVHHHEDVNVAQANNDKDPGVNTEPVAAINDVFRNTLADDTEEDDGISLMLRNAETGFLSEKHLKKLEKMREDGKTSLYKDCPMTKLEADIMVLEFKSTNGLSDKGFDKLLGIIGKMLPAKNELPEKNIPGQANDMSHRPRG
jgi:hypothetical protein